MTRISFTAAFLGAGLAAPMALADVTAEDVWNNLVTAGDTYGEQISGTLTKNGNITNVSDMSVAIAMADGAVSIDFGGMSLTERSDGTVLVQIDASTDFAFNADLQSIGETFAITGTMTSSGFNATASGDPDNVTYTYAVPSGDLSISNLKVEADELDDEDVTGDVAIRFGFTEFNSVYNVDIRNGLLLAGNANYGAIAVTADADIVADGEAVKVAFKLDVADLIGTVSLALSEKAASPDLASLIAAGLDLAYNFTSGASTTMVDIDSPEGQFTMKSSATGGKLNMVANGETLSYGGENTGITMAVSGSDIPFPEVTAGIGRGAFGITLPSSVRDEDGDIGFEIALEDVTVADFLWGLFDPTGKLPRDPATIALALSGKGKLLVDIYAPDAAETLAFGGMPAEVQNINIDRLDISAAGAAATGSGAFTFDNTDLETFDGMPRPEGTANISMSGVNGLMDNLVSLGLLPQDQVLGARMMMGIFARPGAGEDTLESELTIGPDGSVSANGQRLR